MRILYIYYFEEQKLKVERKKNQELNVIVSAIEFKNF